MAAVLLCLVSCKKEQEESLDKVYCYVTECVPGVEWMSGDRISVFDCNSGNKAYVYAGSLADCTEFKYSSGENGEFDVPGIFAVYPWAETNMASSSGTLFVDLPSAQTLSDKPVLAAHSRDADLQFWQIGGALTLHMYGSGTISGITVTGNASEALAGRAMIEFSGDGAPSVKLSPAVASTSVTMDLDPAIALEENGSGVRTVSFLLPETRFDKGITLLFKDVTGDEKEIRITETVSVRNGYETVLGDMDVVFSNPLSAKPGEALPAWEEGYLDIHSINSGRGESFFYIFPDGTTMLVDAAGAQDFEIQGEDGSGIYSKPSREYSSGTVINRYLQHYMPGAANGKIDYFMLSHYHGDHMGAFTKSHAKFGWKAVDRNGKPVTAVDISTGGFLVNGLPEVGMAFPILKLIDRGDWNNRASNVWLSGQQRRQNYINFINWSERVNGTVHESLAVGHTDQIVLKHKPGEYPVFEVRGIAANGNIWTGSGTQVNTTYVPSAADCLTNVDSWDINENIFSCVFTLKYGKFDWFSGGDIQYNDRGVFSWKDIEMPIAKVVGKVEAMKASHHSSGNTNSTLLLNTLKPDSYVIGVWTRNQPNYNTMKRVYAANKDVKIFATNLSGYIIPILSQNGIDSGSFLARGGHVVIRVAPGGDEYYVFVLDDTDFEYRITEIHGPYQCQ